MLQGIGAALVARDVPDNVQVGATTQETLMISDGECRRVDRCAEGHPGHPTAPIVGEIRRTGQATILAVRAVRASPVTTAVVTRPTRELFCLERRNGAARAATPAVSRL